MLSLIVAATLLPQKVTATATIRIMQQARASEESWWSAPQRTERSLRDEAGRLVRLRLVEHE
ncbi:hypothetical protein G7077_03725 [Sphingomonas piscis]|uniref:Uncharacterized protein n=1 Tax=Sphingomonas piscis TaxID=2714943 RepID=A0A6G7YN33_9SPHN|nr:hypothetical protein [Sphingomonas piscis]QIK78153.1 hypothetical protein G7077_03725 [Sphingomonas piscis]